MAQIRLYRQKLLSLRPHSPKLNTPRLLKLNLCRTRRQRNRTHLLPKFLQPQKRQQRHPPKRLEFCTANVDDKSGDVYCYATSLFSAQHLDCIILSVRTLPGVWDISHRARARHSIGHIASTDMHVVYTLRDKALE